MPYSLTCADSGAKCAFSVTTESRDELMEHLKIHAQVAHPDMPPPAPGDIEKLIKRT